MTTFSISRTGQMFIADLGRLVLANNINDPTLKLSPIFQWRGQNGTFGSSCGLVEYVAGPDSLQNFVGHLRALAPALYQTDLLTAKELVILFVQQVPALNFSTVYTNEDNVIFLRTINGKSVQLLPGDVILSDDSSGTVYGIDASGNAFSYNANGVRS